MTPRWRPLGEWRETWQEAHADALSVKRFVQYVTANVRVARAETSQGPRWRAEVLDR